jgi:protein lifeguard
MTGIVGMIFPFSRTMDLVFAIGGTLLFSGYVVYDTYVITKKLSPDEYIMGAISLYLEYVHATSNVQQLSLTTVCFLHKASSIFVSLIRP